MSVTVEVISWRDIPAQVIAREGDDVCRVELDVRFQQAIDQAAVRAGLVGTDDYLAQWRKGKSQASGSPAAAAAAEVDRVEGHFTDEVLARYVANEGRRP